MNIPTYVMIAVLVVCYVWYWFLVQKFSESKQRYASNAFTLLISCYSVVMLSLIFKDIQMFSNEETRISASLLITVVVVTIIHVILEKKYLNTERDVPKVLRRTKVEIGTTAIITTATEKQVVRERYVFSKKGWVLLSEGIEDRVITDTPENNPHLVLPEQVKFNALPTHGIRHG